MKWFQAMAKGAGDQYLSIRDQEREHISKMAQIKAQYDGAALAKEKENAAQFNTSFGDYTLKDRDEIPGDMWGTRTNKMNDFSRDFKSWFMDAQGNADMDAYNTFKKNKPIEHQTMLKEWEGRISQYMLARPGIAGPGESSRTDFNQFDYEFMKPFEEFYSSSLGYDKPRALTNVSQVERLKSGENVVTMFDAVESDEATEILLSGQDPSAIINNPNIDIEAIGKAMMPVLTHGQYGGEDEFGSEEEYNLKIYGEDGVGGQRGTHEHYAVIANIMWNYNNKTGGIKSKAIRDQEIAQAQLYYGLNNDELLLSVNAMMKKFKVIPHSKGRKTIIRMKGPTTTESSAAGQALGAQLRLNMVAKRLLDKIDEGNRTGFALGTEQLFHGLFGEEGQFSQLKSVVGEWTTGTKAGGFLENQAKSGFMWNEMNKLRQHDRNGRNTLQKDENAAIEYLQITLAYNLALSEQGGGGGKAISDGDYKNAKERVMKMFGTVGQNKAVLKELLQVNKADLMRSKIATNDKFLASQAQMLDWWENYGAQFKTVVHRYTNKLANNPVYGQVRDVIIDPNTNQPLKINGVVQFKTRESQLVDGKLVDYRYDGRLSRLFTIDFGDNPDFSAEEGTQGLWDSLGEHEKLVLRSNEDFFSTTFKDTFGTAPKTKMATATEILEETGHDEEVSVKERIVDQKYKDYTWWQTTTNPKGVLEADISSVWGANSESGVWKLLSDDLEEFGNQGHQDVFDRKGPMGLIDQYRGRKRDTINPDIEKIFIKIEAMYGALEKGEEFLKESKKAETKVKE